MRRWIPCPALLFAFAFATSAPAQPVPPVVKLTLHAAAEPVPALRYKLLPELRDTTPGNAVVLYYRAFAPDWWTPVRGNADLMAKLDKATEMPLDEIRNLADVRFVRDWAMLKEVDRAARRQYADWDMTTRLREDGIGLLLPDVHSMREFARFLKVRARLELADGDFRKAVRTYETGLSMSRHVADAPTLIQSLVGAAIAMISLQQIDDFAQTPGSPNLYWALATLPRPFIDIRKGMEGERLWLDNALPGFREALADPNAQPIAFGEIERIRRTVQGLADDPNANSLTLLMSGRKYGQAKRFLLDLGHKPELVEAMPVLQVVMLREVATYDRLFDEILKARNQPYGKARPMLDRAERLIKEESGNSGNPGLSLAGWMLPAVGKVTLATARVDRKIEALMCVEAIRMYAAAHGKLPTTLDDMSETPIPPDSVTGKPFEYALANGVATLYAPPPVGEKPHAGNTLKYELTLAK